MQTEIEVKFLHIDPEDVRLRLKELGAELEKPMRLMRRVMLDHEDGRYQSEKQTETLRVRDEGDKVTVTYKSYNETNYPYEAEVTVSSYDEMVRIFDAIGLRGYSFQESKRETWHYGDVEVVIDIWPWLDPYIEIEGQSEESIKQAAADLGFDWQESKYGSVDTAYKDQYKGMTDKDSIGDLKEARFDMPLPKYFEERLK